MNKPYEPWRAYTLTSSMGGKRLQLKLTLANTGLIPWSDSLLAYQ